MTSLSASPSDSPPAIVTPAATARAPAPVPMHPGYATLRGALTLGGGTEGTAGSYGIALDVWPFTQFGIGAEWTAGGSSNLKWSDSKSDSLTGGRARFSVRYPLTGHLFGTATLAAGAARAKSNSSYTPDEMVESVHSSAEKTVPTFAAEFGLHARNGVLHGGGILRIESGGGVTLFTLGPVLGLTF